MFLQCFRKIIKFIINNLLFEKSSFFFLSICLNIIIEKLSIGFGLKSFFKILIQGLVSRFNNIKAVNEI
jgi:hypothetical protein